MCHGGAYLPLGDGLQNLRDGNVGADHSEQDAFVPLQIRQDTDHISAQWRRQRPASTQKLEDEDYFAKELHKFNIKDSE